MALELLHYSARYTSLRNVVECVDFCLRLETMLVMHSQAIFGTHATTASNNHAMSSLDHNNSSSSSMSQSTLDHSYVSTVKSKALSLIHYTRDRTYRQTLHTLRSVALAKKVSGEQGVFTPLAAASPALPFYLGKFRVF